ncbi:hypothetical protein ACFSBJ_13005 [Haloplanus ruber]|uniref:Uncharacterized protein n=1 Tax=Haloplanus ruber TaxID=869892 RepID=A0ABD6CZK8_9EURY
MTEDGPWYVINKRELRLDDFEYREPQLVMDIGNYDPWFDYYYEGVEEICIYPFHTIHRNWREVESLREDIYELARTHLAEEIEEYVERLEELTEVRDELRGQIDAFDELIEEVGETIIPELRELLQPDIYDRLVDDE